MFSPSGEQFEIAFGDQVAVAVEVGGGLRTYDAGGREVLDGYGPGEMCPSGRGQVLMPWPNRLAGGAYAFGGRDLRLPVNEPVTGSAIHGLVRWVAWRVAERERHRVVVHHDLHPRPGYPFALAITIEYVLSAAGLRVSTTATNVGDDRCPFGAGAHPYLRPGSPVVDPARLHLPAHRVLEFDTDGIPVGAASVEDTEFDFRRPRALGETRLDHCFTDLQRGDDGLARVRFASTADGAGGVTLWVDEAYPFLMLYTGDDRPDVSRRSMAIEPMTCPPQAFRTGRDVVGLDPGQSFRGSWGIAPGPAEMAEA
jgi:aldose 1-epimerase